MKGIQRGINLIISLFNDPAFLNKRLAEAPE